ncbi:hypothetical protein SLS59_007141 [Nothophoma quercina]|uniref:Uncharacterized protein n=1 Tax=Nothophoma quercina TaxID=749835 RepID=A0ABR3R135_9PLEO
MPPGYVDSAINAPAMITQTPPRAAAPAQEPDRQPVDKRPISRGSDVGKPSTKKPKRAEACKDLPEDNTLSYANRTVASSKANLNRGSGSSRGDSAAPVTAISTQIHSATAIRVPSHLSDDEKLHWRVTKLAGYSARSELTGLEERLRTAKDAMDTAATRGQTARWEEMRATAAQAEMEVRKKEAEVYRLEGRLVEIAGAVSDEVWTEIWKED